MKKSPPDRPRGRPRVAPVVAPGSSRQKDPQRSRITNGSALLPDVVDGRSPWVRRAKDVIAAHLGFGRREQHLEAERSIIRRASVLTVELEAPETKFALAGGADPVSLDLYQRTAGNLRRLLEAVGLQRRAREILPDPLEYAREVDAREQTEQETH